MLSTQPAIRAFCTLVLALVGTTACSSDTIVAADGDARELGAEWASGRGATTPTLSILFGDRTGDLITSDAKGIYNHGTCGVNVVYSGIDVVADILASGGTAKKACTGRTVSFTLSTPSVAGDPTWGTASASVHIKLQTLTQITTSGMIDAGFNQLTGVGDCSALRFNQAWGGDRLLATRVQTAGVNGATRDSWVVESVPGADRAACINSAGTATLRLYHMPVHMTLTRLN